MLSNLLISLSEKGKASECNAVVQSFPEWALEVHTVQVRTKSAKRITAISRVPVRVWFERYPRCNYKLHLVKRTNRLLADNEKHTGFFWQGKPPRVQFSALSSRQCKCWSIVRIQILS